MITDPQEGSTGNFGTVLFDAVDNPVIQRLALNWEKRATVKRDDPDLLDLFDPELPDYPDTIVPFKDHHTYQELSSEQQGRS